MSASIVYAIAQIKRNGDRGPECDVNAFPVRTAKICGILDESP